MSEKERKDLEKKSKKQNLEAEIKGMAIALHTIYEKEAKKVGWKTQDSCKVEFDDLPPKNKEVMLSTAKFVFNLLKSQREDYIKKLEGKITNFENGKSRMCWKCSYWGKDCECYHNRVLKNLIKALKL